MNSPQWSQAQIEKFFEGYFYAREVFYISDVLDADAAAGTLRARVKENTHWQVAQFQRGPEHVHPRHVNGSDLIALTASLGALHAYFFHQCLWEDGWVGFGNRIENAEFKALAAIDRPLELKSTETRLRKGAKRVILEFDFEFSQDGKPVYLSRQMATFLKREPLGLH
jgi:hypothetical protein